MAPRSRRSFIALSPFAVDGLIAVTLLLMTGAQVAAAEVDTVTSRFLLFAPAVTLPVAWRRRAPLVTLLAVGGALTAQSLVTEPFPAFGEFLAVMLATYSVAAHAAIRVALVGLLVSATAVAVQGLRDPSATSSFEFVYGVVYFGGAWLLGRAVRRRRRHTAELEHEALRLKKEREESARAAVAEERRRIAGELHDVIAHCVSVIVIQAAAAEESASRAANRAAPEAGNEDSKVVREALRSIRTVGNDALAEMRRLLGVLRAEGDELRLDPQPGLARLDDLVGRAPAGGLDVQVTVEGQPRPLPPGVDLAAYRVIQEALTNVRKHAGTAQAWVHLRYLHDTVEIEVVDDGNGRQAAADSEAGHGEGGHGEGGHGLIGMRERVLLYGGIMAAAPRPEAGFVVQVCLPAESSSR